MTANLLSVPCANCGADRASHDPAFKDSMEDSNIPYAGFAVTLMECTGYVAGFPLESRHPSVEQTI